MISVEGRRLVGQSDKKSRKALLRREILDRRQKLSAKEIECWSRSINEYIIGSKSFQKAQTVMAYVSFRNEVDVSLLIQTALNQGKQVLLPVTNWKEKRLSPVAINAYPEDLVISRYGIAEPVSKKPYPEELINLVIIPGVAFDIKGYRLGYGQGFYDRFLARLSAETTLIGVGFSLQILDTVYAEEHDFRLPLIVTEKEIYQINNNNN